MKNYSSTEIIKIIKQDGWELARVKGDDHFFKHSTKDGFVSIPHPQKVLHPKTISRILKNAKVS